MKPKTLKEENVEIATPEGHMSAFMVSPDVRAAGTMSAVVVIQEAFGVNHHIKEVCRRLAHAGYLAIAPELFHREGPHLEFGYDDFNKVMPTFSKLTNDGIRSDIGASLAFLESGSKIPSKKIAVMGFCVGGLGVMISATAQPIGMAIAYYGGGMTEKRPGMGLSPVIQDFSKIQCPVLMFFGDKDQSISIEQIKTVEAALTAQHKKHEVVVYPGVGHAFSNDDRPSNYNEAATKAAWEKSLAWLSGKTGQ